MRSPYIKMKSSPCFAQLEKAYVKQQRLSTKRQSHRTAPIPKKKNQAISNKTINFCCQVASVVSDSVRPQRRQPTRLPHPWDSPGKNTGVGCHFLLQCMKVKSDSEVAQSCLTLSDPRDCSLPPSSSVHGIFQARVLEWSAINF